MCCSAEHLAVTGEAVESVFLAAENLVEGHVRPAEIAIAPRRIVSLP